MRPYLAIIKDSFRAAIASRVLYVLLVLITLFLLAIAPFSLKEKVTTEVADRDILTITHGGRRVDPESFLRLCGKLVDASKRENSSQKKLIWEKLSPEVQTSIVTIIEDQQTNAEDMEANGQGDPFFPMRVAGMSENIRNDLNRIIKDEDLFNEESWRVERLSPEAQELAKKEKLTGQERARLNRILVSSAFPNEIDRGNDTSLDFKYAVWDLATIPARRDQVKTQMGSWMPYLLDKGVLSIGVFIAILVTAPIIPQTFDPGALNLLLSKPVSRSMLLLSKFFGGCAFVAICAVYLFVGMWLIFGIKLGIWNSAILISIPIYVLVFAIYYSVSTTAGVIWRNTVICVVLAILFWLTCFSVGVLNSRFDGGVSKQQIGKLVQTQGETFGVDGIGATYRWNNDANSWEIVLLEDEYKDAIMGLQVASFMVEELGLRDPLGPVYLKEYNQVVGGQSSFPPQAFNTNLELIVSAEEEQWTANRVTSLPMASFAMFNDTEGRLMVATKDGKLFRLKGDPLEMYLGEEQPAEPGAEKASEANGQSSAKDNTAEDKKTKDSKAKKDKPGFFSKLIGSVKKDEYFERVKIQGDLVAGSGAGIAINQTDGRIAISSSRRINFLIPAGDGFKVSDTATIDLPGDSAVTTSIAIGGKYLLAARGNGNVLLFGLDAVDGESELLETFQPEPESVFRSVSGTADGSRFAITFTNGSLWLLDSEQRSIEKAPVSGQQDISAAIFDDQSDLIVVDRTNRLNTYQGADYVRSQTRSPKLSFSDSLYRYGIRPIYTICPKPGEFYKLIDHLSISDSEDVDRLDTAAANTRRSSPWSPLWSGLGFMAVVLILACIYFERQEF